MEHCAYFSEVKAVHEEHVRYIGHGFRDPTSAICEVCAVHIAVSRFKLPAFMRYMEELWDAQTQQCSGCSLPRLWKHQSIKMASFHHRAATTSNSSTWWGVSHSMEQSSTQLPGCMKIRFWVRALDPERIWQLWTGLTCHHQEAVQAHPGHGWGGKTGTKSCLSLFLAYQNDHPCREKKIQSLILLCLREHKLCPRWH